MSGQLTMYGAGQILRSYFGGAIVRPNSLWMALIATVAPTPYVNGDELDEVPNNDYSRAEVVNDTLAWMTNGALNVIVNTREIDFTEPSTDWGTIRYWALCDFSTGGQPIMIGRFTDPATVNATDQPRIAVGEISVSLGPFFSSKDL